MGIGTNLKRVLKQRSMTIKELSEKSGVSLNTLYFITKTDTKSIDSAILSKILSVLECTEAEIVIGKTEEQELAEWLATLKNNPELTSDQISLAKMVTLLKAEDWVRLSEMIERLKDQSDEVYDPDNIDDEIISSLKLLNDYQKASVLGYIKGMLAK